MPLLNCRDSHYMDRYLLRWPLLGRNCIDSVFIAVEWREVWSDTIHLLRVWDGKVWNLQDKHWTE